MQGLTSQIMLIKIAALVEVKQRFGGEYWKGFETEMKHG